MTDPSYDEVKALMPNKTISSIGSATKAPTRQEIDTAIAQLAANARTVPSDGGDGRLGHVVIIIGNNRYQDLSNGNVPFIPPLPPLANPVICANPNYAQITEANRLHGIQVKAYKTYKMVESVSLQMLLEAIHPYYKSEFFTDDLGYMVELTPLLTHLRTTYCKKTAKEIEINKNEMKAPWNAATEPIQALFTRVDKGHTFDDTIPESTFVRDTVTIICKNQGFDSAYDTWEAKDDNNKTWPNLKIHFGSYARIRLAKQELHDTVTYPGSANATIHPSTPTTPPATPLEALAASVASLSTEIKTLLSKKTGGGGGNGTTQTTTPRTPCATNPAGGREPTTEEAATMSYCWSHGYCPIIEGKEHHTSASCKGHRIGHKTDATSTTKMNGETRICNSWKRPRNNNNNNE
jgi:hypothetical protein